MKCIKNSNCRIYIIGKKEISDLRHNRKQGKQYQNLLITLIDIGRHEVIKDVIITTVKHPDLSRYIACENGAYQRAKKRKRKIYKFR